MLHIPQLQRIRTRIRSRAWYWIYQKTSLALLIVSLCVFLLSGGLFVGTYFTAEIIILVNIIQLSLVTLIRYIHLRGLQAISLSSIWRSIRFRITLWYTIILAIVLLTFSNLVTQITLDSQIRAIDDTLRSHLIQVASTYNPQTQQLTLPVEPDLTSVNNTQSKTLQATSTPQTPNKSSRVTPSPISPAKHATRVSYSSPEQDIYLLFAPSGQVLQASPGIDQNSGDMARFLSWLNNQYVLRTQPEPDRKFLQNGEIPATKALDNHNAYFPLLMAPRYLEGASNPMAIIKNSQLQLYDINFITFYKFGKNDYRLQTTAIADQQGKVTALIIGGQYTSTSMAWQDTLTQVQQYAIPLTVLLASIGGFWLADNAMKPVQKITSSVRQITATDLHKRLRIKQKDELGDLASTFDEMLDRLEGAFERQRQFTADASHELRTPLAIIDLETTRALSRDYTTRQYWQAMKIIQQENQHMARLVNDLLMLARADSGQDNRQYEELDLGELTLDTVERLIPLAQQTGIKIQVASSDELLMRGDHSALGRMISNIIENALKYSVGSGTQVDINFAKYEIQGCPWARLSITDNGPGIAAEHLAHIFERFYRVDAARTHTPGKPKDAHSISSIRAATRSEPGLLGPGGSGLGLSIARWIVHAHGGEIDVQSQPGHGTTFEIWLPLLQSPQSVSEVRGR